MIGIEFLDGGRIAVGMEVLTNTEWISFPRKSFKNFTITTASSHLFVLRFFFRCAELLEYDAALVLLPVL